MKKHNLFLIASSAFYIAIAPNALAKKMDMKTQGYVIDKLEAVLSKDNAPSRHALELRLGDLYSEQARLVGLEEAEGRCPTKDCKLSFRHRGKALSYYQKGLKGANATQRARAKIQMAHLHKSLGQDAEAIAIYREIIRDGKQKYDNETIGLAHSSIGEIYYLANDFSKSVFHYDKAYNIKETPSRGHALYRIAWCRLNLGNARVAIRLMEHLAKSEELLTRKISTGTKYDIAFHEEVSRDLATFYARYEVGETQVANIVRLSPERAVKSNLIFLATEADRLGQKKASLHIWAALVERKDLTTFERIEAQTRIAQIRYDLGSKKLANKEFAKATDLWRQFGCNDKDQCEMLRLRMRNFVTEWNKKEVSDLSKELSVAYETYIALFNNDLDMQYWAAGVAFDRQDWKRASKLYRMSSLTAHSQLDSGSKKDKKNAKKIFEGALLAEIDVSERSGSLDLKERAYEHYLELNPTGDKALEVRYQRAKVDYDRKNYPVAAEAFRRVALNDSKGGEDLKKQAANLSLDALAFSKDDSAIDSWALGFAKTFPKSENEFLTVSRRARLNHSEKVANAKDSSRGSLESASKLLQNANLKGASKAEKIAIYKNRMVIAEKTKDIDETVIAANALYALPGLSEHDNEYALMRKAWAAEMKLDFKGAYYLYAKTSLRGLSNEDKALKLATLAELGGLSASTKHYHDFIEATGSKLRANQIRAKLVLQARNPDALLSEYSSDFSRTPEVLGTLAYELFVKHRNYKRAERMLDNKRVRGTTDGRALGRLLAIRQIEKTDKEIARHRIRASSDRLLQRTLKERLALLAKIDGLANEAINSKDWTLQILALSTVREQNERIYRDLADLPVPTGLSAEQRAQYLSALKAQAEPYKQKTIQVTSTLNDLWGRTENFKSLYKDFDEASYQGKRVVRIEAVALSKKAEGWTKSYLDKITDADIEAPSHEAVKQARARVQANPYDLRALRELRDLEKEHGRGTMVAYLEERLALEKTGG